ncbi:membrane protein PTM1 [Colletotrichum liriopes]|uniref:Membrane protein PTM1 n=1 Tax=Colletotrichum liriopes TaxID=708192 RepID=A0AA37LW86_9PEZI|nr:membrane protein PTM1 [Colletotrichum liriopes]
MKAGLWATVLGMSLWTAGALEVKMLNPGMYSRSAWGGPVDPYINVMFLPKEVPADQDPVVSLVIFEWKDEDLIGVRESPDAENKIGICQDAYVQKNYCNETDIGKFIIDPDSTTKSKNMIETKAIHLKEPQTTKYMIRKTGYYCVLTDKFSAGEFTAVVEFRNAYGELPATQIPKLPFYGGITILYALVAVYGS